MMEYAGVKVVNTAPETINTIYKEKKIEFSRYLDGRIARHLNENEYVVLVYKGGSNNQSVVTRVKGIYLCKLNEAYLTASGIIPRNKEQYMAMDALLDDTIKVVVLTGKAGTGKTILALAAAMQKFEEKKYDRMILTRPMSWVGRHGLGSLPGDSNEKFEPYLQNYMSNIEVLLGGKYKSTKDLIHQYRMDFIPIQLIRGASYNNALIIADEVQVLDYDEMVTLGTRIAEGSKIIIMGDLGQRDEKIAREKTGIYKFVNDDKAKASPIVASIDLLKCVRSSVAALFADIFER